MLVGVSTPNPLHFGTTCPEVVVAEPALTGLFLVLAPAGMTEQGVYIVLDGNHFPHGALRGAVRPIKTI